MFNAAQLHLAVNHLPVVGVLIGFFILVTGIFLKQLVVKRTALVVLVFAAITVAPAYLSGEPAEEIVEHKAGVTEALIHAHEESAELSLIFTCIVGGVAALTLALGKMKRENLESKSMMAALGLSIVTFGMLANTAHLGGLIRHDELRSGAISAVGETSGDKDDDDD